MIPDMKTVESLVEIITHEVLAAMVEQQERAKQPEGSQCKFCVAHQPQLLVQLGEADVDLDPVDDLEDLLIEGHRLEVEPLLRVGAGHLLEAVGRVRLAVHLLVQLGQLLQDPDVVRIHFQDALVFLDGLVERALRDELRGGLDDLVFVHRPEARWKAEGGKDQRPNVTGNPLSGQGCNPR